MPSRSRSREVGTTVTPAVAAEAAVTATGVDDARVDGHQAVVVEQQGEGRRAVGQLAQGARVGEGAASRAGSGRW